MPENYNPEIKVENFFDGADKTAFEYYINQIHEMDKFVGELVKYLSERDEQTILVMYGDHLPGFNFTNETLSYGNIYQTPYVIWDNIGLKREYKNMEAYQLSSYVFGRLGIQKDILINIIRNRKIQQTILKI